MENNIKYFKGSFIFTFAALIFGFLWAHHMNPGSEFKSIFVVFVLSILEVSLSFDNAVINAAKLEKMSALWQHRFLTWGIWIAVFGMRFLFPLLVVAVFSKLSIIKVFDMALNSPNDYAHYLHISHPFVITFGASFLIMLFFNYFFNSEKKVFWLKPIEKRIALLGKIKGLNTILTLAILYFTSSFIGPNSRLDMIISGLWGIGIYLFIDGLSSFLEKQAENTMTKPADCSPHFNLANHCFINFLYLELIDASFSLDGVLGAFALSKDILIIAIGLSIGAMFVRSLTIMLVEKKTLKEYIYLEHGAHWAIGALAVIMFISSIKEVSEIITGLIGVIFISASFVSSLKEKDNG